MLEAVRTRILPVLSCAALLLACPGEREPAPEAEQAWPAADLVAVDVVDTAHWIVVAATGGVHVSRDAGRSWIPAETPGQSGLHDVSMADAEVGWIVGDDGILVTHDGGASWRAQVGPQQKGTWRLTGVAAIDRARAVAVGAGGLRVRTVDGGRSWREVSRVSEASDEDRAAHAAVACLPGSAGRCSVASDGVHETQDAGRSWRYAELEDPLHVEPIPFARGQVEIAATDLERLGVLLAERPRLVGLEWRIEPAIDPAEVEAVERRRDPQALFALIDARLDEVRSVLEAGGIASERVVVGGEPPWGYEDYLDDDPHVLDRYWSEHAAPTSSIRIRVVESPRLRSICLAASGRALAVGGAGAVARRDTAGGAWELLEPIVRHDLLGVAIGRHAAVAVGAQGVLRISEDGGATWSTPEPLPSANSFDALRAVSVSPDGEVGVIVGEHGRVLRSLDGGRSWQPLVRGARAGIDTPAQGGDSLVR